MKAVVLKKVDNDGNVHYEVVVRKNLLRAVCSSRKYCQNGYIIVEQADVDIEEAR